MPLQHQSGASVIEANYSQIRTLHQQLIELKVAYWKEHSLFSFQWWLLIGLSLAMWTIWWKTVNRRQLREIVLVGALCLIITTILDGLGSELMVWSYRIQVTPTFGRFIPVDFAALPITSMLLYQICKTWKLYFLAVSLTSSLFAFVFEPFATWIGIYDPLNWKHIYSLPFYIAIFVCTRWLVEQIVSLSKSVL